jgi:PAS domain S-box-containing protein
MTLREFALQPRTRVSQVVIGLLCSGVGIGLRVLLAPYLTGQVPWATSLLAVLVASVLAGSLGAATTLVASAIAGTDLFISPHFGWRLGTLPDALSVAVFVLVASCIAAVAVGLRRLLQQVSERAVTLTHEVGQRELAERALRARSEELISENDAMAHLHALGEHCANASRSVQECLKEILATALRVTGAEKGNVQLYDEASDSLQLVVHSGFPRRFVEFFANVDRSDAAAFGTAFTAGQRVVVEDITVSPIFAGQPSLEVLLEAGVRAVQSTPLTSGTGHVVGMLSTHFSRPHRPSERECRRLDVLARQAADYFDRKRAEEAVRTATEQLQVVTDSMTAPVTRCSRDLKYVWVSKPYAEWIGRPVDEISGRPIVDVIGPAAFEQLQPHFERVLSGEVVRYEEQVVFEGIGARWIAATYTPTLTDQGICDGWVAVVTDVTDRKRAQQSLEVANRQKDEFLAMLGHELRNPLAAIRNAVATASLDGQHRDLVLAIARRQTEQLGRLVDDLLDVARITQGRITLRREPVLLKAVVERAVEATQPYFDEREHTLTVDVTPEDSYVDGDAARLEQVLVNLLSNACKYTNPRGQLSIAVSLVDGEAVIRVRDSGVGIAPQMLPRIFELFVQAERSLDRSQGGLGIGLTVAAQIVDLHGGRLEAFSEGLGKGAEFRVRLPALDASKVSRVVAENGEVGRTKRAQLLMVEDNFDAAEGLRLLLEVLGHHVRVAHSGVEAMNAARVNRPDLMLIDIGLPGIDGYEVARRLRREPTLQDITLVAMTGYGSAEDRSAATAAGFNYHLVKPIDLDRLEQMIRRLPS